LWLTNFYIGLFPQNISGFLLHFYVTVKI
jgi:hypothetical protein